MSELTHAARGLSGDLSHLGLGSRLVHKLQSLCKVAAKMETQRNQQVTNCSVISGNLCGNFRVEAWFVQMNCSGVKLTGSVLAIANICVRKVVKV